MGITEELKSLEEMKVKGTLTEAEFAAAKTATISKHQSTPIATSKPAQKKKSNIGLWLLLLGLVLILFVWYVSVQNQGTTTSTALKAAAHMPVDLKNEVENLPANSWKAVPLQVPYAGLVTVTMQVQRGNPVELVVTDNKNVEELKSGSRQLTYLGGFYAPKAMTFQHSDRLNQGTYFVVMRDSSLGILSASTSDISLKVRVEP
jgi:hypothetical protein